MDALTAHPASPIPDYPVGRGSRIIVIDDDDCVGQAIQSILARHGHEVLLAPRASAGIQAFESATFDAALIDLFMPGMNGRELARRAEALRPGLPVLYMTGYSRNAVVHQGRLDEGVELVQKPISQSQLANRIREILDRQLRRADRK